MELAKIRNKARQESAGLQADEQQQESTAAHQDAAEIPLVLPLPDDLPKELCDLQPVQLPVPGPIMVRSVAPALRFDPLAIILDGREQDRTTTDMPAAEAVQHASDAGTEPGFEEFLCFRLGDEEYGINIMEIKEIIKPRELTEVPRTPAFVDGVLSLRGVIVSVFNMRKRLAMSHAYDKSQERIVIVRCGDGLHGLRVDRVTDVVRITEGGRETTPSMLEGIAREFVAGIGRTGSRMVIILDIGKVVDTALDEVC